MFFRKRREAKKAKAEATKQQIIEGFERAYDDALVSMDPADKILKLEDIKENIDLLTGKSKAEIVTESQKKFFTTYMGVGFGATIVTTIAATVAAFSIVFPPVLTLFAGIPGVIAGRLAGQKRMQSAHDKMMKQNKPFFDALEAVKEKSDVAIESAKRADMRLMAKSPRFTELMDRVPSLREKFAEAYRRSTQEGDLPEQPKPKKPGNDAPRL